MTVHVILPVHNRAAITAQFLVALRNQTFEHYRLVLVDDGCTDETVNIAIDQVSPERLVVLHGDGQLWWAGALQLAYEHLRSQPSGADDAVLLINDDLTFGPDFLSTGMGLLRSHPAAAFQAVCLDRATGVLNRGAVADTRRLTFRGTLPGEQPNCLATRGLLMKYATFVRSGGFRPRWLPHYLSDYEFTLRLRRQGVPLICDDTFTAEFDAAATGESDFSGRDMREVWSRALSNRAKLNPKHWSAFAIMVSPPLSVPGHLLRIWLRFGRAVLAARRGKETAR